MPPVHQESQPISLNFVRDDFYRHVLQRVVAECRAHYGERLVAIYVWGSVHRGEAVPAVPDAADLDLYVFTSDGFHASDKTWLSASNDALNVDIPGARWGWIPPARAVSFLFPEQEQENSAAHNLRLRDALQGVLAGTQPDEETGKALIARTGAYMLLYDATRVWGRDLTAALHVPPPDPLWARAKFQQVWDIVALEAGQNPPLSTAYAWEHARQYNIPAATGPRLRTMARLGVMGGAYLLIALGQFHSFRGIEVLPVLRALFPQWEAFLSETNRLYVDLTDASEQDRLGYMSRLVPWTDWVGAQLADH